MIGATLSEISVIGSLLISPETLDIVSAHLIPSDFESDTCAAAYRAALELRDNGEVIDPVTIESKLRQNGYDARQFLLESMQTTPTAANIEVYCKEVKRASNLRRMSRIAQSITDGVYSSGDWRQLADSALEQIAEIDEAEKNDVVSSSDAINEWWDYYTKVSQDPSFAYCATGYKTLDKKLGGGFVKDGLYIIGARPGMGKTTLGINIAENIAKAGKSVLIVSLEMSTKQITAKRIAKQSGLNYTKLINGGLTDEETARASCAAGEIYERPFYISDKSKATVADIGRAARQVKDLSAIFVDYLGLIRPKDVNSNKPRYEEMTDISADLKALAKLLKIPVIALCQLNRESSGTQDKRPKLNHLRDTGAIEQDADGVLLLYRPEYYVDKTGDYVPPEFEDFEIDVAKNRHGETGIVKQQWRGKTGDICELETIREEPHRRQNELPFRGGIE